jgi:hypothetical protein
MKDFIEFVGFGSILQLIVFVISLVWYGSRYGFRIENLEKDSNEQKVKHTEHDVEKKTVLSELQKIREWQIARDAKDSIISDFTKSNEQLVEAIKSLRK